MENRRDVVGSTSFLLLPLASCSIAFRGVPLNVIQLSWLSIFNSKGVGNIERS